MKNSLRLLSVAMLLLTSVIAFAGQNSKNQQQQRNFAARHPRRAEVLKRDRNERRANNAAARNGKITQGQANRLNREDANIKRQEQSDARKNGGYITPAEKQGLNREENTVNRQRAFMERQNANGDQAQKWAAAHPARASVLRGDNRQTNQNNAAEATGKINSQQANQLDAETRSIHNQEQADAAANGGHITGAEAQQLHQEENQVAQQRNQMEQQK